MQTALISSLRAYVLIKLLLTCGTPHLILDGTILKWLQWSTRFAMLSEGTLSKRCSGKDLKKWINFRQQL